MVCNISSKAEIQWLKYILECGIVEGICGVLSKNEIKMIAVALQSLIYLLKKSKAVERVIEVIERIEKNNGLSAIEQLQLHSNSAIYKLAVSILEQFFAEEDQGVFSNMAPSEQSNTNSISIFQF